MKILVTGGGTGGHIYPAISIAKALLAAHPGLEVVFAGTRRGLERDVVPKAGFRLEFVRSRAFERRLSIDTLRSLASVVMGAWDAAAVIRREQPAAVIGTGGYVCGPVVGLAALMGIPTVIHEQNSLPGVTNRLLGRFVSRICVAYPESVRYFPKGKAIVTGNPVRPEIVRANRDEALRALGLSPGKYTLIVVGASQGAKSINTAMVQAMPTLVSRRDLQVVYTTGPRNYEQVVTAIDGLGLVQGPVKEGRLANITISPYRHDMENVIAAADLAVSRGGAIFLAELAVRGVPAIVVPLATAAENHQEVNARILEAAGAATVILDRELTGELLTRTALGILDDAPKLVAMKRAAKALGKDDALGDITAVISKYIGLE